MGECWNLVHVTGNLPFRTVSASKIPNHNATGHSKQPHSTAVIAVYLSPTYTSTHKSDSAVPFFLVQDIDRTAFWGAECFCSLQSQNCFCLLRLLFVSTLVKPLCDTLCISPVIDHDSDSWTMSRTSSGPLGGTECVRIIDRTEASPLPSTANVLVPGTSGQQRWHSPVPVLSHNKPDFLHLVDVDSLI